MELADAIAPTTAVHVGGVSGENNYNNVDVTLTFTAEDNTNGSGVEKTEYRLNGGEWSIVQGPVAVSAEGKNTVEFRSTDKANNIENTQSIAIWIDKTAPEVSYQGSVAFYQTDTAVNLAVTAADSFSGMKAIGYTLDGVPIGSIETISPLALSAGDHALVVFAEDHAGNKENTTITLTSKVDMDHLAALISIGESNNWITNHGTAQSLQSNVKNIQKAKDQNQMKMFEDLIKEITKDSGNLIDSTFAEFLLNDLKYIQAAGIYV